MLIGIIQVVAKIIVYVAKNRSMCVETVEMRLIAPLGVSLIRGISLFLLHFLHLWGHVLSPFGALVLQLLDCPAGAIVDLNCL